MADPIWPIANTLVHTRGTKTEVAVHALGGEAAALVLRFGGASDVTIHCKSVDEIIDIEQQLRKALAERRKSKGEAP
jgi:hypothetical protein